MSEEVKPQPKKSETPEADRLSRILMELFGTDWQRTATVTMSVADLYWIVQLAETGIKTRLAEWKSQPGGIGAGEACSIGSFRYNVKELVNRIENAVTPISERKKK